MFNFKLHRFQVKNFRNLLPDIVEFGPGINCIMGENGNGKTNLLEAIYFCINHKSFRKNTGFSQFLSIDAENFEIYFFSSFLDNLKQKAQLNYSGIIQSKHSQWSQNSQPCKGKVAAATLFINPLDGYHFHQSAQFRRGWIDQHLGILSPNYKKSLNKAILELKMRNRLLSLRSFNYREQIQAIDTLLAPLTHFITNQRLVFLHELGPFLPRTFQNLFSEEQQLLLELNSPFKGMSEMQIFNSMRLGMDFDLKTGRTTEGIHRDDYALMLNGLSSYEFSSLGQQKMSYLSLVFAYIELFRYKFKSYPIVLIDDISGELDRCRWRRLIDYLEKREFQVLITTANENFRQELEKAKNVTKLSILAGGMQILSE